MEAESITVSLEWAKKLKAAGWPQSITLFYWAWFFLKPNEKNLEEYAIFYRPDVEHIGEQEQWDAPTLEEILRKMPKTIFESETKELEISRTYDGKPIQEVWDVCYRGTQDFRSFYDPTLANAAAAMYCYLSKNGLLPKS